MSMRARVVRQDERIAHELYERRGARHGVVLECGGQFAVVRVVDHRGRQRVEAQHVRQAPVCARGGTRHGGVSVLEGELQISLVAGGRQTLQDNRVAGSCQASRKGTGVLLVLSFGWRQDLAAMIECLHT